MSLAIVAGYGDLPTIMLKEMNNIDYIVIDLMQNRDPNRLVTAVDVISWNILI